MAQAEAFEITTGDQTNISATLYTGDTKSNHLIIVCPATGAPQGYYRGFAEYAADYKDFDVENCRNDNFIGIKNSITWSGKLFF